MRSPTLFQMSGAPETTIQHPQTSAAPFDSSSSTISTFFQLTSVQNSGILQVSAESNKSSAFVSKIDENMNTTEDSKDAEPCKVKTENYVINFCLASKIATKLLSKVKIKTVNQIIKEENETAHPQLQLNMQECDLKQQSNIKQAPPADVATVAGKTNTLVLIIRRQHSDEAFSDRFDIHSQNLTCVNKSQDIVFKISEGLKNKENERDAEPMSHYNLVSHVHKREAEMDGNIDGIDSNSLNAAWCKSDVEENKTLTHYSDESTESEGPSASSAQKDSELHVIKMKNHAVNLSLASDIARKLLKKVKLHNINKNTTTQSGKTDEISSPKSSPFHMNAHLCEQQQQFDIKQELLVNVRTARSETDGLSCRISKKHFNTDEAVDISSQSFNNSDNNSDFGAETSAHSDRQKPLFYAGNLFQENNFNCRNAQERPSHSSLTVTSLVEREDPPPQDMSKATACQMNPPACPSSLPSDCIQELPSSKSYMSSSFPEISSTPKLKERILPQRRTLSQISSSFTHKTVQPSLLSFPGFSSSLNNNLKTERKEGRLTDHSDSPTSSFGKKRKRSANPVSRTRGTACRRCGLTRNEVPGTLPLHIKATAKESSAWFWGDCRKDSASAQIKLSSSELIIIDDTD